MQALPLSHTGPRSRNYARPANFGQIHFAAHDMGLDRTDPKYIEFTRKLRNLAPQFLDTTRCFRRQDPERWDAFFNKAVKELPLANEYEGCWPVEGYMKRHLDKTQRKHKEETRTRSGVPRHQQPTRDPSSSGSGEEQNQRTSQRTRAVYHYHSREVLSRASSTASSRSIVNTHQSSPEASIRQERTPAISKIPAGKPESFRPCNDAVRFFLQCLQPSMEELVPKFMDAGLVNKLCLVSLAGMPDREKDKLLRDDMFLSAFQMRVVRVGLLGLRHGSE